jgi:hypothetical protein
MFALDQPHFRALPRDLLKTLLEQPRLVKGFATIFGERGMIRNLLVMVEAQTDKPAPG